MDRQSNDQQFGGKEGAAACQANAEQQQRHSPSGTSTLNHGAAEFYPSGQPTSNSGNYGARKNQQKNFNRASVTKASEAAAEQPPPPPPPEELPSLAFNPVHKNEHQSGSQTERSNQNVSTNESGSQTERSNQIAQESNNNKKTFFIGSANGRNGQPVASEPPLLTTKLSTEELAAVVGIASKSDLSKLPSNDPQQVISDFTTAGHSIFKAMYAKLEKIQRVC